MHLAVRDPICIALVWRPCVMLGVIAVHLFPGLKVGAHDYTFFAVEGKGAQGQRPGDIAEFGNFQVEVIVPPAVAEQLLHRSMTNFPSLHHDCP